MGAVYFVVPLDHQVTPWLMKQGVSVPDTLPASRNPRPREVKLVLVRLPGCRINTSRGEIGSKWQASVTGDQNPNVQPSALIEILDFAGDNEPQRITFSHSTPSLLLTIVKDLTAHCGPLVVLPDTGQKPLIVSAQSDVHQVLLEWAPLRLS